MRAILAGLVLSLVGGAAECGWAAVRTVPDDGTFAAVLVDLLTNGETQDTMLITTGQTAVVPDATDFAYEAAFDIDYTNAAFTDVTTGVQRILVIQNGATVPLTLNGDAFNADTDPSCVLRITGGAYWVTVVGPFTLNNLDASDDDDDAFLVVGGSSNTVVNLTGGTGNTIGNGVVFDTTSTNCIGRLLTFNSTDNVAEGSGGTDTVDLDGDGDDADDESGNGAILIGNGTRLYNCVFNSNSAHGVVMGNLSFAVGHNSLVRACTVSSNGAANADDTFDVFAAERGGVHILGENNRVEICVIQLNAVEGLYCNGFGNTVNQCVIGSRVAEAASGNTLDGVDDDGFGNRYFGNFVKGNGVNGFLVSGTTGGGPAACVLKGNRATANAADGFNLADGCEVVNNRSDTNTGDGYQLTGDGNRVAFNLAATNTAVGFNVEGDRNWLQANRSRDNTGNEFELDGTFNFLIGNSAFAGAIDDINDAAGDDGDTARAEDIVADGNGGSFNQVGDTGTIDEQFRIK